MRAVAASTFELAHRHGLVQCSIGVVRAAVAQTALNAAGALRLRSKAGRRARGGPVRLLAPVGRVRLSSMGPGHLKWPRAATKVATVVPLVRDTSRGASAHNLEWLQVALVSGEHCKHCLHFSVRTCAPSGAAASAHLTVTCKWCATGCYSCYTALAASCCRAAQRRCALRCSAGFCGPATCRRDACTHSAAARGA